MKTTNEKMVLTIGEESRPKIESVEEMPSSIFADVYNKTFSVINEYAEAAIADRKDKARFKDENINNIFTFIGERGSGKTSCMLSVEKALKDGKQPDVNQPKQMPNAYHTIGLIDPAFFDQSNNILTITLAKMFTKFKEKAQNTNTTYDSCGISQKHQQLIQSFQEVQSNIDNWLNTKKESEDSLDKLVSKAASSNLHNNMFDLVEKYLDYFSEEKKESFLVLAIDDIDLHTSHAYEMVEQIRKYLVHPNIIILLSVKLDQLELVVQRHYIREFKDTHEPPNNSPIIEMGTRYLEKLIPLERRFFLPVSDVYLEKPLCIQDAKSEKIEDFASTKEGVLALIFRKTRFLFYNTKGKISYIIPRNLRELRHLIKLLFSMEEYDASTSTSTSAFYNKTLFKRYFLETWIPANITLENQEIIQEFSVTDVLLKNKFLVDRLSGRYEAYLPKDDPEVKEIIDKKNMSYNISIGDVVYILNVLTNTVIDNDTQKFIFSIKSIYSMLLYEYYDEITEYNDFKKDLKWGERVLASPLPQDKLFRKSFLQGISNYEKLVGGNFINSYGDKLLPNSSSSSSRTRKILNGTILNDLCRKIEENKGNKEEEISIQIQDKEYKISFAEAVNLVEFFALTISRREDSRKKHRLQDEAYYISEFISNVKNYWFDITSITYNIICIKESYNRLYKGLADIAQNTDGSLLVKIESDIKNRYGSGKELWHSWLSWACIRNMEVLDDWMQYRQHNRPKGATNDAEVLAGFFKNNGQIRRVESTGNNYQVCTYDKFGDSKPDSEDYYEISFGFLNLIGGFLDQVSKNDDLNTIFSNIYQGIKGLIKLAWDTKNGNLNSTIKEKLFQQNLDLSDEIKEKIKKAFPNKKDGKQAKTKKEDALPLIDKIING